MRRLRILQIFNRYIHYGGEEGSVFRIGDALQDDHDVEYFFGSTNEFLGNSMARRLTGPMRAFYDPQVSRKLRRYQQVGRFDLWQIHNVFPGLSPAVYQTAFSLQVPIVHFLHNYRFGCVNGNFFNHGQPCQRCLHGNFWPSFATACWHDSRIISGWQALILLYLRKLRIFHRVDRWIALSDPQRQLLLKIGFPAEQTSVIPHFFEPRGEAPLFPSKGAVLFLSRLSPEKGGRELLAAWDRIAATDRELWIAGSGPEEGPLRQEASSLPGVKFLGFLDIAEKERVWAESSFAVIPSLWPETFGMIVLEAWARARPVVAYRIGALAQTITHGVDGLLVDPGDTCGLATAIQSLAANPSKTQSMGLAGRAKLERDYRRTLWLSRMNEVYRSLSLF